MNNLGFIVLLLIIFIFIFFYFKWMYDKSKKLIFSWAKKNAYEVQGLEFRLLRRGPFFLRSSEAQTVFYVTLKDATGNMKSAYFRCGGFFLGLYINQVSVKWDH